VIQTTGFILDFIRQLLSATANASLFGTGHPQVVRLTGRAFDSLLKALGDRQEFSLAIIDNELVIDGQPQEFSLFVDRFVRTLRLRGIGHIRLSQGIARGEVTEFIEALARQGAEAKKVVNSSEHIRLGRIDVATGTENRDGTGTDGLGYWGLSDGSGDRGTTEDSRRPVPISLPEIPAAEMARLTEIYEAVRFRHKLKITGIIEIVSDFVETFRQEGSSLLVLAALRETDAYTFTHSTNVCILNLAQAMALGIEGQLLNDIGVAGMLHDIGKLFIPEEILTKKEKLTRQEFELMQTHPVRGARYLLETPGVPRLAIVNAFEHHMKYDHSGYPEVPSGWEQNICSHLTTIADVYDALRTRRPYREPLEHEEIRGIMEEIAGSHLHPGLTKHFLEIVSSIKAA